MPKKTSTRKNGRRTAKRRPTVKRVMRMVKQLKPEVKEITYAFNALPTASLASVSFGSGAAMSTLASGITQGTGRSQRVGNMVRVIGIQIRLAISGADSTNNFRIMLVKPKSSPFNTGSALIQNILSGTPSGTTQWLAPIDTDRYHVLFDKMKFFRTMPLDGNSSSTTLPVWIFKKFIKTRSTIQWDAENNPDPRDWILAAISDSNLVPNPGAIAGHVKLYYTDA
ncbi:putative structural protein [Dragonfly cyclicusvirus]|uniref:Putative structural protein n=1 Tax=Dragonfly cyclicusvirus TaxID=1234878 RepID=K0A105_9VIRU|nr:putative structural protein [Dragonfly cyclicusvirus]AFS65304.1 putative structural protein [Dragonfly cyclicusvirus]